MTLNGTLTIIDSAGVTQNVSALCPSMMMKVRTPSHGFWTAVTLNLRSEGTGGDELRRTVVFGVLCLTTACASMSRQETSELGSKESEIKLLRCTASQQSSA